MPNDLAGTVALVSGASSGIGEATAVALAADGASVVLVARRTERLADVVATIAAAGGKAVAVTADVTDREQAANAVAAAISEFGRLDILINNAGVMLLGPVEGAPIEQWEQMVDVNVMGVLYCTHAALPHLLAAAESGERRVADVVTVSSVAGRRARAGSAVYNLTKHAVGAFSEALRQEVTERHVRVGLVEPGAVETELISHNLPAVRDTLTSRFEGWEKLEAADIAESIRFMVTRPRYAAINEILVRPTQQRD